MSKSSSELSSAVVSGPPGDLVSLSGLTTLAGEFGGSDVSVVTDEGFMGADVFAVGVGVATGPLEEVLEEDPAGAPVD